MAFNGQRSWEVTITDSSRQNVLIKFSSEDTDPHRLIIDCHPLGGWANSGLTVIKAYNISFDEQNRIKRGAFMKIKAGYKGTGSIVIFEGQLRSYYGQWIAPDYVFSLYGFGIFYDKPLSINLKKETYDTAGEKIVAYLKGKIPALSGSTFDPNVTSKSLQGAPLKNLTIKGDTYIDFQRDFTYKTGNQLKFNSVKRQFLFLAPRVNRSDFNSFSAGKVPIDINNNTGMVGYPREDIATRFIRVVSLLETKIQYLSVVNVDVSAAFVTSIEKTLAQQTIVSLRKINQFIVLNLTYSLDTRGGSQAPWYVNVIGSAYVPE